MAIFRLYVLGQPFFRHQTANLLRYAGRVSHCLLAPKKVVLCPTRESKLSFVSYEISKHSPASIAEQTGVYVSCTRGLIMKCEHAGLFLARLVNRLLNLNSIKCHTDTSFCLSHVMTIIYKFFMMQVSCAHN